MDSIHTTAATADQLLVSNNIIKLEPSDKNKRTSDCSNNPVLPFVLPNIDSSAHGNVPLMSISSPYPNLSNVGSNPNSEGCSVANYDVGSLRYLEAMSGSRPRILNKPLQESKPILMDGSFINDLVPRKHELRSGSVIGSESRSGLLHGKESRPTTSTPPNSYIRNYNNSLKDLPSGCTEADFGIVKEELQIEDIEEGAEYSCLSSHSGVTENLFSNSLPESIDPFIKESESESLLKTDIRMNENVTQENLPNLLDLLNKPVKPVRRQRVKKTPKIGARLSSVINKLAQSKETIILTQNNASSSGNSNSQSTISNKTIAEICGATEGDSGRLAVPPNANTASVQTTIQNLSNAQVISNSTNQCLENSISNKCDEFSIPPTNLISANPASESIDKTKPNLVVDRLKRLGTSIEFEKPTTDAFEPNITVGRMTVDGLNKSETSITIEPQPFVTTRSISQAPPTLRVPPTKSRTVKKAAKPSADSEATTPKSKNVKSSPNLEKSKPAAETTNQSSLEPNPSIVEPNKNIILSQYNDCLNMLESLVKADNIVKDITKTCIKNKTNRKINKNVLKYDSKLSKQNWKSNLVTNESSPSKTTLILNKTIPSKTKIKIVNNPVSEPTLETNSVPEVTESVKTSQKIDAESVKTMMVKHNFTIGDKSILEMNGHKMYTCDVCSGVYQQGFSLKRHYLRSHINYYFIRVKETEAKGEFTIQLSGGADGNGGLDPAKALMFRCHVCGTCFHLKSELKGHLTGHPPVNSISSNDVKVYKCINCSQVFNKKKEFSKHRKTCVVEVPIAVPSVPAPKQRLNEKLPCLFCPKVFPSPIERKKHGLKMHYPKKKVHPCFKCVETFQTQSFVFQHLREIHKNDYFSCSACKERFHNDLELKSHCTKKHHGNTDIMAVLTDKSGSGVIDSFEEEKPIEYNCNLCSKTFSTQSNLNKHNKSVHFPEKDDKVSLSPKHVVILSKSGTLSGKETKDSKTKIDVKSKSTSKSKSDPKNKDTDTAFYSELSDNIQFNLMHHIDGKLQGEKKKDATVPPNPEITVTASQSAVTPKIDSSSKIQNLSQLDLVGKAPVNKGASTSTQSEEKPKSSDRYSDTLNYTEDMSHLDIATQLTMKRNLHLLNSSLSRAKSEAETSQVCGNIRLKRVKDLSKDLSLKRPETLCAESFGDNTFDNIESDGGLSGIWTRPHNYVCVTCGSQSLNFWDMEDHKWNSHPNVKCAHYEFTENHLPGWEFFTSRTFDPEGMIEPDPKPDVPSVATNRSRCSKCKKTCGSTLELHRHMLECGLDTQWMLTLMPSPSKKQKEKKKWRPFGSRRRRMSRVRGLKRNIPNSPMKIIFPPKLIKSKSGDTETIQKMIANLPAKRATRRVVIFDNVSRAMQATINSVPITSLNWNNNTYEDGLLENLLINDQQGVPSRSIVTNTSNDSITTSGDSKDGAGLNTSATDLLTNPPSGTRIVPIWPPAEQSDVLTSLRMMPIPQVPMVIEPPRPIMVLKTPELEVKPTVSEAAVKPVKPVKKIKLRSVVRQLSASSLETSSSESPKKLTPDQTEKTSGLSSRSSSPRVSETSSKVNGSISENTPSKTSSAPTSPSKILVALSKYSVKKPSDLAKEKSTILDAMRIAMANSKVSDSAFNLKPSRGKKLLQKSLSESLLIGQGISLKPENVSSDENKFCCTDCNKVFKNGAVLKRHRAKCSGAKSSEDLSVKSELPSSSGPLTAAEIETLISKRIDTEPKTDSNSAETKITSSQSKADSENGTVKETPLLESTTQKPAKSKTKKSVVKNDKKTVETKMLDKKSKTLKAKNIKETIEESAKSDAEVKVLLSTETEIDVKLSNGKEESSSNLSISSTAVASDKLTEKAQNLPSKSKKKVSILKKNNKTKAGKNKANNTKMINTNEAKSKVDKKQLQPPKVEEKQLQLPKVEEKHLQAPKVEEKQLQAPKVEKKQLQPPKVDKKQLQSPKVEEKQLEVPKEMITAVVDVKKMKTQSVDDTAKPIIPDARASSSLDAASSDSDSDSTPLVQLKEIIMKTYSKPEAVSTQKKVLVSKVKKLKKKPTVAVKNARAKIMRKQASKAMEEAASMLKVANSVVEVGKEVDSCPKKQIDGETVSISESDNGVKPVLTEESSRLEESKKRQDETEAILTLPQKSNILIKKRRKKPKRLLPRSKKGGLWKRNKENKKCGKSKIDTGKIDFSHDLTTKVEDEIKDEPSFDQSFKLCLSEDDKEDDIKSTPACSTPIKEKPELDDKTDVKEEFSGDDFMTISDAAEIIAKQDVTSDSSFDDAPLKPKRSRRSAYNLLFTHLKQEDMTELLTTIKADRHNLKRKCTLVDPQPAVDKKPRKIPGKSQDEESTEVMSNADATETLPESENLDTISVTSLTEKPDNTEVAEKPDAVENETEPLRSSKRGKPVPVIKAGNVKKTTRSTSASQTTKSQKTTRSKGATSDGINLTQTALDNWSQPAQSPNSDVIVDSKIVKEAVSASVGKVKQKQMNLDEASSTDTSDSPVTTNEAQSSLNNRKNKNQKSSMEIKNIVNDEKSGAELKPVSRSSVKLRSSVEMKNNKVSEVVEVSENITAPPSLVCSKTQVEESQNTTHVPQAVVSLRTRAKKSSQAKVPDVVANTTTASEPELNPNTPEPVPKISTVVNTLPTEDAANESDSSLSKTKNTGINAKITEEYAENVESVKSVMSEVSDTSLNLKKRKRPKKSVAKDLNLEVNSEEDDLPLSSLSEENIASSLSRVNSEDTELSDDNQKTKKVCVELSANSIDSVDAEGAVGSDEEPESLSENFLPLLKAKNKSKSLKRKRRKEFLRRNFLQNLDSPMTSDSEASILRVRKKQLKSKKSNLLASDIASSLEGNSILANSAVLRKQLAKLKTKKDLKKVLDLIKKGGNSVSDANETSELSVAENSQSNESLSSVNSIIRKKKLKKKKSKKKLKNFKDKDLVNVLVQTVAKTANKLLTKSSEKMLRKKQLKLQRKKALKKLSHANNDWQISIVNPESNETSTTEIPDSSNDLEENKKEIDSDVGSNKALAPDVTDGNESIGKASKKFYCALCDKHFLSLVTLNKHFLTWNHRYHKKLIAQQATSESLKASSIFSSSVFDKTQISLSSLKNKLSAATKSDEAPTTAAETSPALAVATTATVSQEVPASVFSEPPKAYPVLASNELEPIEDSHWHEQEWSQQGWQMNQAPVPVDSWFQDTWPRTSSYETASLGSILDSVNQILADPTSVDPHSDPMSQYSLADLQQVICASDEEMAILQRLGENIHTPCENEFVYDNSATQQGTQPASFNEWTCESTDLIDLDNQNPWSKTSTPATTELFESKSSQSGKETQKPKSSAPEDFDIVEMTCPTPTCAKKFHGITALRTHISWAHSNNKRATAYCNANFDVLTSCMSSPVVDKRLVCFVCKEICNSSATLDSHVSTSHVRKKMPEFVPGPSKLPLSDGAEKLKSKMSSAFGGLLDRALNNLKLNPLKARTDSGETKSVSDISNETLKFLGQLKEVRRVENMENKNFTSNLAKELRKMIDREKYEKLSLGVDGVNSPRSSIDSDADVTSTTNKNDFLRPYSCPLCNLSFETTTNRNRHISVQHGRTTAPETETKFKPVEIPRKIDPCIIPERKKPGPKIKKTAVKTPRKRATKKQNPDSYVDSTVPDFQCDNCQHTVSMTCDDLPVIKKAYKTKKPAKPAAAGKKSPLKINDTDLLTKFDDDSDSTSLRSFSSRTQTFSSDIDTESNGSQNSMIKHLQTALQVGMKKKLEKEKEKEALTQQEIQRQNEAFDLLLGKETSPETSKTTPKKKKPAGLNEPVVRMRAEAALKVLPKGKTPKTKKDTNASAREMPALKPVKAATTARVPRDIPAPVLKPISNDVPKLSTDRKKKPPSLFLNLSKPDKNNSMKPNTDSFNSIDTSSCDSDSCKLKSPSFCDLSGIEPYSSSMIDDSTKGYEEDKISPVKKPDLSVKKPISTLSKCDNISELEQLFSDDDSDQEMKIEKSEKKTQDKISPESLKSITAFRDSMKILKDQSTSETKSNAADVYNFEDFE